jgi:L,D-peptidoglycan transpeptidase YkuD (ErfK/YbiS/YcfS/YnhG family)
METVPAPEKRTRASRLKSCVRMERDRGKGRSELLRHCIPSKRDHIGGWVGQAGAASNIREDEGASPGVRVCILSEDYTQASHRQGKYPWTGEAAIMMYSDTKKDVHTAVEIHYNQSRHEHTPHGRGLARVAGQSCLAGPSVAPAAPRLRAQTWMRVW